MIEMISVTKRYQDKTVLEKVSLSLAEGEIAMICGPSGAGKSTLLRTLNRMESINEGDIQIQGSSLYAPGTSLCALRAQVGLVFQHCNLFSHLTTLNNIVMPLVKVKGMAHQEAATLAHSMLAKFGLAERADAFPSDLSGGERQRTAIIRCLAMQPLVMLFDEPTSALDWRLRLDVADNIRTLADQGLTQLIVTHDLEFACALGDRFFLLENAQLREVAANELACCGPDLGSFARKVNRNKTFSVA